MKACRATRSRPVVGSSSTSTRGAVTSARASKHPTRFAARHLVQPPAGQMRHAHPLECLGGAAPHVRGHDAVAKNPLRREEAGEHRGVRHDTPFVVAEHEAVMQVRRHDAELRSQLEHVPVVLPEYADRRCPVLGERPIFVRQQPDERRFAGAIRAEDGGVLVGPNRQRSGRRGPDAPPLTTVALESSRTGEDIEQVQSSKWKVQSKFKVPRRNLPTYFSLCTLHFRTCS